MRAIFYPTACFILGIISCKNSSKVHVLSPEVVAGISRIQIENSYSDAETRVALEQWIQAFGSTKETHESFGSSPWTPEKFNELMLESDKWLEETQVQQHSVAVYSLIHLIALNEKRYEDLAESLRKIIADHYNSIESSSSLDGLSRDFLQKVQDVSKTDRELNRLISEAKTG